MTGRNSFTGDTPVLMGDGSSKPIAEVKVGDEIANAEPDDSAVQRHLVTALHITDDDHDFVDLTMQTSVGSRTVVATAHHRFWNTTTQTWTDATDLRVGDQLSTPGDGRIAVQRLRRYAAGNRTYNLTINTVHTYYVIAGSVPVLVHNDDGPTFDTCDQARRDAMRQSGLPTGLQPRSSQYYSGGFGQGGGYQYVYDYNGATWVVTDNWNDLNADTPHGPH